MIDLKTIEKLLDLLDRSDADTIEVRRWMTTIRVSKSAVGGGLPGAVTYQVGSNAPPAPAPVAAATSAAPEAAVEAKAPAAELIDIKAPMVGTFYTRPEPGAEPYVQVGSRITPGQTLCIIEAMKIMNPIESEVSGVIREIAVSDATPVEFGQALFKVDPHA
jgi:acetyl-CoA carboxylase biotin carboxyl carrier protein